MVTIKLKSILIFTLLLCFTVPSQSSDFSNLKFNITKLQEKSAGAPKYSDVVMRSLRFRPKDGKDTHNTLTAMKDFHVTRLEWTYIGDGDKKKIHEINKTGRIVGGAAASTSIHKRFKEQAGWYERMVIRDLNGKVIIAPWKRTWKRSLWSCMNNPEVEEAYIEFLKQNIDLGAKVMHRDEPGGNHLAIHWGGCFCQYCMRAFQQYLQMNTSDSDRMRLGIKRLHTFDYKEYLKKLNAPVGTAFKKWNGGELKRLFVDFQLQSTVNFHNRTRRALDSYAGRNIPFSCNNGVNRWTPVEMCFDWVCGELNHKDATPGSIYQAVHKTMDHNRSIVMTMPKSSSFKNPDQIEPLVRKTIAMAYACGARCMVPWDVYMPGNAPRYFGKPEQYADLFGFIRANSIYIDGYEEIAVSGTGFEKELHGKFEAVEIIGNENLWAVVRQKWKDPLSTLVVHMVDWGDSPNKFEIKINASYFFKNTPVSIRLLIPLRYDKTAHNLAEKNKNYSLLSKSVLLKPVKIKEKLLIDLPALNPWGILIISANNS